MKNAQAPDAAPEAPVRVAFQVQFSGGLNGRRRFREETTAAAETKVSTAALDSPAPGLAEEVSLARLPKITQLLVLGHHFEKLVREGAVKDYAEIARLTGLSRARVTQITNLTLLPPEIQEELFELQSTVEGVDPVSERDLRAFLTTPWFNSHALNKLRHSIAQISRGSLTVVHHSNHSA